MERNNLSKMKMNQPNEDATLRATLRQWKETSPLPPRFEEQVWQRIQKAETRTEISLVGLVSQWLEKVFARPVFAGAYIAVLLFAGTAVGYFQAQRAQVQLNEQLSNQYFQSIDPYQKVASNQ